MKKLFLLLALSFWAAGLSAQKKQSAEDVKIMQAISQCMENKGKQIQINSIYQLVIKYLDYDDIFL